MNYTEYLRRKTVQKYDTGQASFIIPIEIEIQCTHALDLVRKYGMGSIQNGKETLFISIVRAIRPWLDNSHVNGTEL